MDNSLDKHIDDTLRFVRLLHGRLLRSFLWACPNIWRVGLRESSQNLTPHVWTMYSIAPKITTSQRSGLRVSKLGTRIIVRPTGATVTRIPDTLALRTALLPIRTQVIQVPNRLPAECWTLKKSHGDPLKRVRVELTANKTAAANAVTTPEVIRSTLAASLARIPVRRTKKTKHAARQCGWARSSLELSSIEAGENKDIS